MLSSRLLEQVFRAVETLPPDSVHSVIAVLESEEALPGDRHNKVLASVALSQERVVLQALLSEWESGGDPPSSSIVAASLRSSLYTREAVERATKVELVWTGPPSGPTFRRTDQALLQVIQSAKHDLLLVTFAAYRVPLLINAIRLAVARGVTVRFIGESVEDSGGKVSFNAANAFGDIAKHIRFYGWPREKRQLDSAGHFGALHAKCALADDNLLLISSANLTDHALLLNMEMGLLIQGGLAPTQVRDHFRQLIERDHLVLA